MAPAAKNAVDMVLAHVAVSLVRSLWTRLMSKLVENAAANVPPQAWAYKLGNRSALEWILDQYKEKTPKDPTIREKFNTYRFADYKEKVADLIARVARVSVETVAITEAMKGARR